MPFTKDELKAMQGPKRDMDMNDDFDEKIYDASYSMQEAYQTETTMYTAIDKVHSKYPTVDKVYLKIMWRAIDAYVDLNT